MENETPWETSCREVYEETGIDISKVKIVKIVPLHQQCYKLQNKVLISFLVICSDDFADHTFRCRSFVHSFFPEIDQWQWVNLSKAKVLLHESQRPQVSVIQKEIGSFKQKKNQRLYE